jgi:hypothetical protein
MEITFRKTGSEIKTAIARRRSQLQQRLDYRNRALDEFLQNSRKVRSYLVRGGQAPGHSRSAPLLYSADDISSEEQQEIAQLCNRIFGIEQELHRLALYAAHLPDDQTLELEPNDLIAFGFDTEG